MRYADLVNKIKETQEAKIVYGQEQRLNFLNAFRNADNIHIIHDYDADGICSALIMTRICEAFGANVRATAGNRKDGYGIPQNLDLKEGELVICCDLGSNEKERLEEIAKITGIKPYVIDHHETLIEDDHILNPPKGDFCTSGLCFLLAVESKAPLNMSEIKKLGAIGTIADMCDMLNPYDFNRETVLCGLRAFNDGKQISGIDKLTKMTGLNRDYVSSTDVAFGIAPLLNAWGRMNYDGAGKVYDRLNNGDIQGIQEIIEKNNDRKGLMKQLESVCITDGTTPAVVIVPEDYLPEEARVGFVGLVASNTKSRYDLPTIALIKKGDNYVGSCRNADGFPPIRTTLSQIDYIHVAGHDEACGIEVKGEDIERFKKDVKDLYKDIVREEIPEREPLEDWKDVTVEMLYALEPFGRNFPKPYIDDVVTITSRKDLRNDWSLLVTDNGTEIFGQNIPPTVNGKQYRVQGELGISTFAGRSTKRINFETLLEAREITKQNERQNIGEANSL